MNTLNYWNKLCSKNDKNSYHYSQNERFIV